MLVEGCVAPVFFSGHKVFPLFVMGAVQSHSAPTVARSVTVFVPVEFHIGRV